MPKRRYPSARGSRKRFRTSKTNAKRKRYGPSRSIRSRRRRTTVYKSSPVPMHQRVKMRYCATVTLNPGVGGIASHEFGPASIFDPDVSGVGHQPMGHDEWALFYQKYVVTGATISAKFIPQGEGTANNGIGGILYQPFNDSVPGTLDAMREQKMNRYKWINDTNSATAAVKSFYSPYKSYGHNRLKSGVLTDDRLFANMGSSPQKAPRWVVWYGDETTSVDPSTITVNITITYYCYLSEPLKLNTS